MGKCNSNSHLRLFCFPNDIRAVFVWFLVLVSHCFFVFDLQWCAQKLNLFSNSNTSEHALSSCNRFIRREVVFHNYALLDVLQSLFGL